MRAYQQQYLDLLAAKRLDGELTMEPVGPEAFLDAVRQISRRSLQTVAEGTRLLREELFPVLDDLPSAPAEQIACLREFADKLMVGVALKDAGLAYRIHSALLDHARRTGDRDMLIRELYWVGMSLYHLETMLSPSPIRLFSTRMRMRFAEGASHFDTDYDEIADPEIRGYIHRCMGNIALGYSGSAPATVHAKLAALKRSITLLSDADVRARTPSLPWDQYLYVSHQERTTVLNYLRSGSAEPDAFAQVLESAQFVQQQQMRRARERGEPLQPRWQYAYLAALYHCGAMTLPELLDALYALSVTEPDDSYDLQSMFSHASIPALYMEYMRTQNEPMTDRHAERIDRMIRRMIRWMARVPNDDYGEQFLFYLRQTMYVYAETPRGMPFYELVQNVFALRHPTSYARLWRSAQIARTLCAWAVEDCPEQLTGLLGCESADQVREKREELLSFAGTAGRLYDTGMVHCFNTVLFSCRWLFEEEHALMQLHAFFGYELLSKHASTAPYADVAYGHHCHYDEKDGYPISFSPSASPLRPMIYIMSVADAISAGTDKVGSLYTQPKSMEQIYGELLEGSGSQYAPFVVELLRAPERRERLSADLDAWAVQAYEDLYRRRQSLME